MLDIDAAVLCSQRRAEWILCASDDNGAYVGHMFGWREDRGGGHALGLIGIRRSLLAPSVGGSGGFSRRLIELALGFARTRHCSRVIVERPLRVMMGVLHALGFTPCNASDMGRDV